MEGRLRSVFVFGGLTVLIGRLVSLAIGASLAVNPVARTPVPLAAREAVSLPPTPFAAGPVVVYRTPSTDPGADTGVDTEELLGCLVRSDDGRERMPGPSLLRAVSEGELLVDGETLQPLVATSNYVDGDTIQCTGPGVGAMERLYVAHGTGTRGQVTGLAFVIAALALPFGLVALRLGTRSPRRYPPGRPGCHRCRRWPGLSFDGHGTAEVGGPVPGRSKQVVPLSVSGRSCQVVGGIQPRVARCRTSPTASNSSTWSPAATPRRRSACEIGLPAAANRSPSARYNGPRTTCPSSHT